MARGLHGQQPLQCCCRQEIGICSSRLGRRFPPTLLFLILKCCQACPENEVDIVPGRHIPEDSVPEPNPAAFDWGPSELVEEKEVQKKKGGTRGLHLQQTDYFSGGLASWGSHDYSGFTSTDVRMRPRHRYPPEQVECCQIFPAG